MTAARSPIARAAAWSIGGSGLQYAVSFVLLVYLARILTPRDFGLIATVSIGLDLGIRVARWGQVELLQQERYRTDQAYNQSLRLSLAVGALFTLVFVMLARPIGAAFQSPQLVTMILISAPVFLFSAAGSTPEAQLRTQFRFNVLAVRNYQGLKRMFASPDHVAAVLAAVTAGAAGLSTIEAATGLKTQGVERILIWLLKYDFVRRL